MRGMHVPETVEYGISSFCYERRKPFHPQRFDTFMNLYDKSTKYNILRAKGFLWIAHENDQMLSLAQCGKVITIENEGQFFDETWGDRRNQIVFIGKELNKDELIKELDECLLNDEEMALGPEEWAEFECPEALAMNINGKAILEFLSMMDHF